MLRKFLMLLILFVPGIAHAEWMEASSPHFTVYGDDSADRLRKFVTDLERFDQAMRAMRGLPNEPVGRANRITIYMLYSTDAVERLSGSEGTAGFYIGRAGGSTAFVPRRTDSDMGDLDAQTILFHEYSHHLMRSVWAHSAFPAWLVEGWAEFHATARINRDGSVLFGSAPNYRAWGLLQTRPVSLQTMFTADTARLTLQQIDGIYGRGWALTHYLTFEPSRRGQLGRYIEEINKGLTPLQAASVFGDLRALDRELNAFINRSRITGLTVGADRVTVGAVTLRTLTRGEAAMMPVRIRSKRGVSETTAPPVYADARRIAAAFPNDPGAQIALAEAAFDAKDYPAAEAAADRAIAANPDAIDARIYKAMTRMEIALAARDFTPETWRAIRALIVVANKLDPDHPVPLILYYRAYAEARQNPPQVARNGLYRAFELAPYDNELRINVAQLLISEGDDATARGVLRALAYDPHGGELAQTARAMIARIDARTQDGGTARVPAATATPSP